MGTLLQLREFKTKKILSKRGLFEAEEKVNLYVDILNHCPTEKTLFVIVSGILTSDISDLIKERMIIDLLEKLYGQLPANIQPALST